MYTRPLVAHTLVAAIAIGLTLPHGASALSCLPTDMYLKDIVGKDDVVVFEATVTKQLKEKAYTAEVVTVREALQGYVEETTFVYHELNETWGYLCNPGPAPKAGETSIYVASRDSYGKYQVHQRLEVDSELAATLIENIEAAEVEGQVSEITATDRQNQIITTIGDMLNQIVILLKELNYWKNAK
jgi:hypothetical protein